MGAHSRAAASSTASDPSAHAREIDAEAAGLGTALDRVAVALAMVAVVFLRMRGWKVFGFARLDDHARERFDRTGRWFRDMAALGDALERLPSLADAMVGMDGGRPLGRVAALLVGRVATEASLADWIARARSMSVRRLREEVRATRPDVIDSGPLRSFHMRVPADVKVAFEEVFDLYCAVEGTEASVASFIEALTAEAAAGGIHSRDSVEAGPHRDVEEKLAQQTALWEHLPHPELLPFIGARGMDSDDPVFLDQVIRTLIRMEDDLEKALATLLRELAEGQGFWRLRFTGSEHYGEQRLGLSRRMVRCRAFVRRRLAELPGIRRAYVAGEIGLEATMHLVRLASGRTMDLGDQEAWVARARECTVKRLRDEAREATRRSTSTPLSDAEWHASLRRAPGRTVERLEEIHRSVTSNPVADVFLHLRLPKETLEGFLGAMNAAKAQHAPLWVGLLALLEEFARTWDVGEARKADRVYVRDGWRCVAPGCSSRRNLEAHHVRYRSHGGGDDPENLVCLCRFHHQHGEHGELLRVRGRAPLDLTWRLGRKDVGVGYQNERRLG